MSVVSVSKLPGFAAIASHHGLDVFPWLPGAPFMVDNVSDSVACRYTYAKKSVNYTFIYYTQVRLQ